MRLMRLCTNPPAYLRQFYAQNPHLANQSYAIQYRALAADSYGWADFWTHALAPLGYEVWEPVGNAEPAQKVWARERGVRYRPPTWLIDIAIAQGKSFQPDAILVNDWRTYPAPFWQQLRSECPSLRLVLGWCGAPFDDRDAATFAAYDIVLSNIPTFVAHFRDWGRASEFVQHAFEPRLLGRLTPIPQRADFTFIGSIVKKGGYHEQRERMLQALVENTEMQIWSGAKLPSIGQRWQWWLKGLIYDSIETPRRWPGLAKGLERLPKVKQYAQMTSRPSLDRDFVAAAIAERTHPPLFGLAMYRQLAASRVTFNHHIDVATDFASNMRLFEATGVGTCLLTEWQPNLPELFAPDTEVVTYRCVEEAIEKVRYLLDRESERQQIARAGQQRTLNAHTFAHRAEQLDRIIKRRI